MSEREDSWGVKDFFGGLVGGGILAALGAWMFINPGARDHQPAQGSVRLLGKLLDAIWGIPGGIVLEIIGLVIIWLTIDQVRQQCKR